MLTLERVASPILCHHRQGLGWCDRPAIRFYIIDEVLLFSRCEAHSRTWNPDAFTWREVSSDEALVWEVLAS